MVISWEVSDEVASIFPIHLCQKLSTILYCSKGCWDFYSFFGPCCTIIVKCVCKFYIFTHWLKVEEMRPCTSLLSVLDVSMVNIFPQRARFNKFN